MFMAKKRKILSLVTTAVIAGSSVITAPGFTAYANESLATSVPVEKLNEAKAKKLVISEIGGLSTNNTVESNLSLSGYEYIEVYNISSEKVDLKDYKILYQSEEGLVDSEKIELAIGGSYIVQPGETIVVWLQDRTNESNVTLEDFNAKYAKSFTEEDLAVITVDGLPNVAHPIVSIQDGNENTMASVSIDTEETVLTKEDAIHYTYTEDSTEVTPLENITAPSPGELEKEQEFVDGEEENVTGDQTVEEPAADATIVEDEKQEEQAPHVQTEDLKDSQSTVGTVTMANISDLVITELVPNGGNATSPITGSAYDAYEFMEVYNNSNQPIDIADFQLLYQYPESNELNDLDWSVQESRIIQPGETLVIWLKSQIHDKDLTLADFNNYYKTNLTEQDIAIVSTAGIDNTNERTLTIKDKNFTVITSAHIPQGSKTNNKSINYTVAANASNLTLLEMAATPTPGSVENNQLPEIDYDYVKPPQTAKIHHTPVTTTTRTSTVRVTASLDSEDKEASDFKLYYRPLSDGVWQEFDMDDDNGDGVYDGYIPYSLFVSDTFQYKIIAQVEGGNVSTEEYTVDVSDITFDAQQAPALLITEMMPSSVSHNSRNVFEFVEVYNNTTQPISMKDYDLKYTNTVWVPDETDKVLNPGETAVYWIMNDVNRGYTVEDFNKQYGTNLTEDQIIRVTGSFANDSSQTLSIISKTGEVISSAKYYDQNTAFGIKDVSSGFSVHYAYPQNGSTNMIKYSYLKAIRTPGKVEAVQVPEEKVNLADNADVPTLKDLTAKGKVSGSEDLTILFQATDDTSIKKAQLFYKFKGEDTYRTEVLAADGEDLYARTFDYVELIGKEQMEYYVSFSDGTNVVESKLKKIKIESNALKTTGFNIDNQSVVSGKVNLKMFNGNGTLTINGEPITNTTKSLAADSYFAFEATGMDNYFQNAVTVGEDILAIYDASVQTYKLLSTTVDASYVGDPFEISVRTGTRFDVFNPESTLNRDDFRIKNIRLVLPDGTVLTDPNYAVEDEELKVGDSSGMQEVFDFHFDIPDEALTAAAYEWDTTTLADGEYKISDGKKTIRVTVDNKAPEIQSLIEDQRTYKQ